MPRLALVVIARDEARCIARCLDSVRPFVDQMIVLDTGSTRPDHRLVAGLGRPRPPIHLVRRFRGRAQRRADLFGGRTGTWCSMRTNGSRRRRPSVRALPRRAVLGLLPIASQFDLHGSVDVATSWIPRLLPRGVRYEGRIHEQPARLAAPQVECRSGTTATGSRSWSATQALLLKSLAESPADPYLLYELGKNYEVYETLYKGG